MVKENHAVLLLPPEVIHHIQSFLNANEAAQSALLSKSWLSAWHTRPNLDLRQQYFAPFHRRHHEIFPDFVEKSMQRYEQGRLRIHSFRLDSNDLSHANEWIVRAMKLGAVDVDFRLWTAPSPYSVFALADELLRSQTLNSLSLCGGFTVDLLRLASPKLKSLCLIGVYVNAADENHDLFMDLLSRCPLLERLVLEEIKLPKLVKLEFDHHKLEYLHLEELSSSVGSDLIILSNSPFLKKLVILSCSGLQNIRICSKSLEHVSIRRPYLSSAVDNISRYMWETELYVPNIRRFKFEGYGWSRLVLKTSHDHTDWESDISINYCERSKPERFIMLNKVLNEQLRLSRVSLSVPAGYWVSDECVGLVRAEGLPVPVVEKLVVDCGVISGALLDALFMVCRPKVLKVRTTRTSGENDLFELISKRVVVEKVLVEADYTHTHDVGFLLRW